MAYKQWTGYGQTDIGSIRDENQDSFVVIDHVGIWCVADGMGGHKEGGIASHLVTQSLESLQNHSYDSLEQLVEASRKVISESNRALCDMSDNFYGEDVIGTTIIALLIHGEKCAVLWAGDSRLYRMRNTSFELITRDHTHYEELFSKGLVGESTNEKTHPMSHMLTRALGASCNCELDEMIFDIQAEDVFLLCSDGLSNVIEQLDLAKIIYYSEDKKRAVANLINMALAKQANDNVTALIVDRA